MHGDIGKLRDLQRLKISISRARIAFQEDTQRVRRIPLMFNVLSSVCFYNIIYTANDGGGNPRSYSYNIHFISRVYSHGGGEKSNNGRKTKKKKKIRAKNTFFGT